MTRAILLDLDGTLIRTLPGHLRAWQEALAAHAAEFPALAAPWVLASIRRTLASGGHSGMLPDGVFRRAGLDHATALRLVAQKRSLYLRDAERAAEPLPGMAEAVRALDVSGFRLAVQTTTPRMLARRLLRTCFGTSLVRRFAAVVGGDDVARLKPAADTMLRAAAELGASPGQCLVIGDSRADLLASQEAGMAMIALHPGRRPPRWAHEAAASTAEAAVLPLLAGFLTSARPRGAWIGAALPAQGRTKNRGFSARLAPSGAEHECAGAAAGGGSRAYVKSYVEDPAVRARAEFEAMRAFRAAQEEGPAPPLRVRAPEPLAAVGGHLVMRHERAVARNLSLGAALVASPGTTLGLLDRAVRRSLQALGRTVWPAGVARQSLFEEKLERYAVRRVAELAELWGWAPAARRRHEEAVALARRLLEETAGRAAPAAACGGVPLMHGDLKLDNLVVAGGELWVIDFEHARACTGADATFDLATVTADTLIRGALLPRRFRPEVATAMRGWLEGMHDPPFGPCFLLACAIQGGTLRPRRRAYPAAQRHGPSHKAIFAALMQAAFDLVLDGHLPAEAADRFWREIR